MRQIKISVGASLSNNMYVNLLYEFLIYTLSSIALTRLFGVFHFQQAINLVLFIISTFVFKKLLDYLVIRYLMMLVLFSLGSILVINTIIAYYMSLSLFDVTYSNGLDFILYLIMLTVFTSLIRRLIMLTKKKK